MRLAEMTCVVTGGAQGIGRAAAERFLSEGASVAILDIDAGKGGPAREALAANGGDVSFHRADVADEAEVAAASEQVLSNYGRIDVLLNNAGVYPIQQWEDMSVDDFDRVIATNLRSAFLCSKAAYTPMKRAGAGSIVNVASELFFASSPGLAHYIASKGGVIGLTRAMAVELGDAGIRVNAIAPGLVLTETAWGTGPLRTPIEASTSGH